MIVFDLECRSLGHRFEGWFASSGDFAAQQERGLVTCPHCGSDDVGKAVMAPNVARKGNQLSAPKPPSQPLIGGELPAEAKEVLAKLAQLQAEALKQSRWVGKDFADESRKMHYGETETETIHGQATPEQAKDLLDEGIALMPLPFPVAPPDELN
jgi:hypothetical protein